MRVKIYGKEGCSYCTRAINHVADLIKEKKVTDFSYIDVVKEKLDKETLSQIIGRDVETYPQVVVFDYTDKDWKAIGGFTEFYIKYPTE